MATLEIPTNGDLPSQIMSIPLDGVRYRLRVYFVFRSNTWMIDVMTDRAGDILNGIKLVPDWPLIGRFQKQGRPPGEFYAIDTSGLGLPPGRLDFGNGRRVRLRYEEAST